MQKDNPILGRQPNSVAKNFGAWLESPIFWVLFVVTAFGVPLYRSLTVKVPTMPPVLGEVSDFSLIDQNNKPVRLSDLRGSVLITNFVFTSCPDTCPLLTKQMAKIQSRLMGVGPVVKLLSISVDPQNDTPQVLKDFATKYRVNEKIWSFLTGPLEEIENAVIKGFKVAFENPGSSDKGQSLSLMQITHGEHFVIVDQQGRIRGYKHARTEEEVNEIIRTVALLANLPGAIPSESINTR
jgi:protein SCO1/2